MQIEGYVDKADEDSLNKILDDLADHLKYMREKGVTRVALERIPAGHSSSADTGGDSLAKIAEEISVCRMCGLCETRTRTVPGQGCAAPQIMFVGEGPGADEDRAGQAFVGRAGQLLTKMIIAMGLTRDEVFIGNIVKCRPPGNRKPLPDEMDACLPFLKRQIAVLKPQVIIALGATAVQGLVGLEGGITKLRGTWLSFENIDLMPTFHPAYLLRNPKAKADVWRDLQAVLKKLGCKIPGKE